MLAVGNASKWTMPQNSLSCLLYNHQCLLFGLPKQDWKCYKSICQWPELLTFLFQMKSRTDIRGGRQSTGRGYMRLVCFSMKTWVFKEVGKKERITWILFLTSIATVLQWKLMNYWSCTLRGKCRGSSVSIVSPPSLALHFLFCNFSPDSYFGFISLVLLSFCLTDTYHHRVSQI